MDREKIKKILSEIIDPELGVNIVDAGLVKDIELKKDKIIIKFMPTTIFCPLIGYFIEMIKMKIKEKFPEKEVEVVLSEGDI